MRDGSACRMDLELDRSGKPVRMFAAVRSSARD